MGQDYRDLLAWQRAMELVERVYELPSAFLRTNVMD